MHSRYGNCITDEVTEMPRCFSSSIQSEVAWREALRARTSPATWMAPPNHSSFSVSVVLPASGWEMIAKVRRREISVSRAVTAGYRKAESRRLYLRRHATPGPVTGKPAGNAAPR
jgi:hypothetical protein